MRMMSMNSTTRHDLVELSGAVLIVYFVITAIMVIIMERLGSDAETAIRIAPVMMPMMITIILVARILEVALRKSISLAAWVLRSTRPARKEEKE